MEGVKQDMGITFNMPKEKSSIIKVIGVGGGGNNALQHMYEKGIKGVDFVVCNTDAQALEENPVSYKIQLGVRETEGLGAGADPEVGKKAAQESIDDIRTMLGNNTKMVFITAGMGGGTGTGAAPVIAKTAKEMGILTVGIVTVPFSFEGPRRLRQAEEGLKELRESVDSLIVINNDKLRQQFGNLGFKSGFAKADEILSNAAKGMAEVITGYFIVNIDFRDAKTVLQNSGTALMSEGIASGDNKAEDAVKKALDSPLLNNNKITGAKSVLLLIRSGNQEVTMDEVGLINDYIQREAGNSADIIWGIGEDESLGDDISVLVIATGFAPEHTKHNTLQTERIIHDLDGGVKNTNKDKIPPSSIEIPPSQNTNIQNITKTQQTVMSTPVFIPENHSKNEEVSFTQSIQTQEERYIPEMMEVDEVEPRMEVSFKEEISTPPTIQEEPIKEYDLFSYADLEPVSFTFDLEEEKKEERFTFGTEENSVAPLQEESSVEFRLESREEQNFFNEINVQEKLQERVYQEPQMAISQSQQVEIAENNIINVEQKEEFTIVEKIRVEDPKIQERRNKLKEFNARFHEIDEVEVFENIPAFKRRNIDIDLENVSNQKITSFVSENKGKMQVRENRFLNKDVD